MSNGGGRVISIFEVRGGSIIGANLAVSISGQVKQPVAMADFDFEGNNKVATLLNLTSVKSLSDILPSIDHLDSTLLKGFLLKHASGVHLLPGPSASDEMGELSRSQVAKICSLLRQTYPYTIIEAGEQLDETTLRVFDQSDVVFFLTIPQLLSLNRLKKIMEKLKSFHYPLSMLKIVINMANIKAGLTKGNIETYMNMPVFTEIQYDPTVVLQSINEGKPAVLMAPHSDFAFSVKTLAQTIIKESELYQKEKKGMFIASVETREERPRAADDQKDAAAAGAAGETAGGAAPGSDLESKIIALKQQIHKKLIDEMDMKGMDLKAGGPGKVAEVRKLTEKKIEQLLSEIGGEVYSREARTQMVADLLDMVLGLGPLEPLLKDDAVSEIMVNGKDDIYVERAGKITLTGAKFTSDTEVMTVIDRILAPIGRRVDESTPLVDARLSDGSRVNVVIPPLSLVGPTITIRKFVTKRLGMEDLIRIGSITQDMSDFLRIAVILRKNIIVSGGTGTGKTTLLNMLSSFIPSDERIVTIEDSAELKLLQDHVVGLESRPPSLEGSGEITIRRMVINTLRMRPDRIVVGECRGGEALDMLQAMNTGHDGSLTTIHSNSPKDAVSRLITLVIMAGTELPEKAIREQIVGAVNMFVQITRYADGSRKVSAITEVQGEENGAVKLVDLFKYAQTSTDANGKVLGKHFAMGNLPSFFDDIIIRGMKLDKEIFSAERSSAAAPLPQLVVEQVS